MIPPQGVGGGIRKLSELLIDTNKDWGKYNITNFGAGGVDLYSMLTAHASRHAYGGADAIPARGIARSQLEYPTVDVALIYLRIIDKMYWFGVIGDRGFVATVDSFADKAIEFSVCTDLPGILYICRTADANNTYLAWLAPGNTTSDEEIYKIVAGTQTRLANNAVDLGSPYNWNCKFSCNGSTLKWFRTDMTTPILTVTDTSLASGKIGANLQHYYGDAGWPSWGWLRAPASASASASAVLELYVEGTGKTEDPFRSSVSKNLAEIASLTGLPDFLYAEAKKYSILKAKGFTDEEIQLLLSYIPQHQVDLDAVTWGAFELNPDKAPTAIITITGDNPYKSGAIQRQIDFAKGKNLRVFSPPRDYREAIALYNQLERDYPHWLAGKDNFAYQTLGWEILDWFQNVDFYYGELLDHKTHYNQLKQVSDNEITNRLNELIDKLRRETALVDERDKHIGKAKEILKKGW
jgi:hypothetical protein